MEDAWIPEAPPTVKALAGYMAIENNLDDELVLSGAESPVFENIELHRTIVDEDTGYARMVKQPQLKIAAGQRFEFKPGGYHLMLLNPSQGFAVNQSIPVNLSFTNGQHLEVSFTIRQFVLELEESGWF